MTLRRVTGRVSVTREDDLDDLQALVLDAGRQANLFPNEPVVAVVLSQSPMYVRLAEYELRERTQATAPVALLPLLHGSLWWYRDEYYEDDEGMTAEEVRLTLYDRERKRQQKFDRLRKIEARGADLVEARRDRISGEVRMFVWQR